MGNFVSDSGYFYYTLHIHLDITCERCGSLLDYDPATSMTKCPHCGKEGWMVDSEQVTIEKIRSQTQKDLQAEQLDFLSEMDQRKEDRRSREKFNQGFGRVIMVFSMVGIVNGIAFIIKDVLSGVLFLIQGGLFALGWLFGRQIIPKNKTDYTKAYNRALLFFVLGLVMFIPLGIIIGTS